MVSRVSDLPFGKSHLPFLKINKIWPEGFTTLPPPAMTCGKSFKNIFRKEYVPINLGIIQKLIDENKISVEKPLDFYSFF